MLTGEGIYANTGSACASKALKTSPVLVAIGVPPDWHKVPLYLP